MPGIPADLSFLRGAELVQVCLGVWEVQFHFEPPASLTVEGDWEMVDAEGQVIDRNSDTVRESPICLHLLLQRVVVGAEVSAPLSFALRFTGGLVLQVFVSGKGGQSFSIDLTVTGEPDAVQSLTSGSVWESGPKGPPGYFACRLPNRDATHGHGSDLIHQPCRSVVG